MLSRFIPTRPWTGFFIATFTSDPSLSAGTACTTTDGTNLRISVTSSRASVAFTDTFLLPLPTLANGILDEIVAQFGPTVNHFTGISAGGCNPKTPPLP